LVIDDDRLVLEGMQGLLESWGCDVVTATSDDTARAAMASHSRPPDLIISDYRLRNGRTGFEAISRLRSAAGLAIPAFLISGDTAPERLQEASASGYHLLHKPVMPMTLRALMSRLLKVGGGAAQPTATSRSPPSPTALQGVEIPNPAFQPQ
jgi:CheY-like chemotaxis protein